MPITVDFSDVQNFDPLPAGVYRVAVVDYEEGEGDNGLYFAFTFEILDGEYANRKLWANLSMSKKAAWKLQEALIAFGEPADILTGVFDFDPDNYLGVECRVAVTQGKYQERITNTISQFLPLAEVGQSPAATPNPSGTGGTPGPRPAGSARPNRPAPKIR